MAVYEELRNAMNDVNKCINGVKCMFPSPQMSAVFAS